MKKILLLSDTHGYLDERILHYASEADEVWHAGDLGKVEVIDTLGKIKPLRAVFGNIDGWKIRKIVPEDLFFVCEAVPVLITHIGGYPNRYSPRTRKLLDEKQPKLFVCGHSHILKVMYDKSRDILHINPGATGVSGFHKIRTMVRFEIDGSDIKNLEVIELGTRALSQTVYRTN